MAETESDDLLLFDDTESDENPFVTYEIATYPSDFTLAVLNEMWKSGDITIPDFQREFIWTIQQSSLLIDSFLAGLPVPPVFFYVDSENKNLVIDGQQRILSVVFFLEGFFGREVSGGKRVVFRLQGLSDKSPYYNKQFKELDETSQRKLRNSVLRAINIRQLEPSGQSTSIYHIFERLNTGGTPLRPQEIRNCVFRGDFVPKLRALNMDSNWRKILGREISDKHQKDVELILRLFSFSDSGDATYEKPMKEFLNRSMKMHRMARTPKVTNFIDRFPRATALIIEKLGRKPFHARGPLNSSILDSVFCVILDNLDRIPEDLAARYNRLLSDRDYINDTKVNTSDASFVQRRFATCRKILLG